MTTWLILSNAIWATVLVGVGLRYRRVVSALRRAFETLGKMSIERADLLEAQAHARAQWERLELELADAQRKSAEYFRSIEVMYKQSQTWEQLYSQQVVEHGHAQSFMMEGIAMLHQQLEVATGRKVPLPPILGEIQNSFNETHVIPVISKSGPVGDPQSKLPSMAQDTEHLQGKSSHPEMEG